MSNAKNIYEPHPDDTGKLFLCQSRRDIPVQYPTIYTSNAEEFAAIYGNDGGLR
jgi:hypothetical protein